MLSRVGQMNICRLSYIPMHMRNGGLIIIIWLLFTQFLLRSEKNIYANRKIIEKFYAE